jgi:hypothetical protein
MPIVTQGIYGGASILKYLEKIGKGLGFHIAKGCYLTTLEPITKLQQEKITQEIKKSSTRFYKELMRPMPPTPSLFSLIIFHMSRTSIIDSLDEKYKDYQYYKEKGWFTSDYYYDTTLLPIKKIFGWLFDFLGHKMLKHK